MTSLPLESTHGQTTSSVTCHHRLWTAHTVERRWAWHAIITFGQHKWSDGVGRGMPSSPMGGKLSRMTSGMECHYLLSAVHTVYIVGRGMPSSPLDDKQGRTTSGMACHHHLWAAQTVERRKAWHSIIAFGLAHIVVRCRAWQAINALRRQTR